MKGSVKQRSHGTWRMRFDIPHPDGSGRRKQKTATIRGTKAQAEEKLRDLIKESETGGYVADSKTSVADFMRSWLATYLGSGQITQRTHMGYAAAIERYIIPILGRKKMQKLTTTEIQQMQNDLSTGYVVEGRKQEKISNTTRRHIHWILSAAIKHALNTKLRIDNPLYGVMTPKKQEREMPVWNTEQVNLFLKASNGSIYGDYFKVKFLTGMRRSEISGLKWANVDLVGGKILVVNTLQRIKGQGLMEGQPKTIKSRRAIKIDEGAKLLLHSIRGKQTEAKLRLEDQIRQTVRNAVNSGLLTFKSDEELETEVEMKFNGTWQINDYVFTGATGEPLNPDGGTTEFRKIAATLDVPHMSLHGLRHSCATHLLDRQIHMKMVSEMLGHSSIATTMNTYSHVTPGLQEGAAKAMEDGIDLLLEEAHENRFPTKS